jgi:5,10-methylene-tetrahydrofolate dehydrogenase/methenyl tetrahydrofolate cyclohydrolase
MPRYHFNLFNDETVLDTEGTLLVNDAEALQSAAKMAREMAAESVREGRLVLDHRIEVADAGGQLVGTVRFSDVVKVLPTLSPTGATG